MYKDIQILEESVTGELTIQNVKTDAVKHYESITITDEDLCADLECIFDGDDMACWDIDEDDREHYISPEHLEANRDKYILWGEADVADFLSDIF